MSFPKLEDSSNSSLASWALMSARFWSPSLLYGTPIRSARRLQKKKQKHKPNQAKKSKKSKIHPKPSSSKIRSIWSWLVDCPSLPISSKTVLADSKARFYRPSSRHSCPRSSVKPSPSLPQWQIQSVALSPQLKPFGIRFNSSVRNSMPLLASVRLC